VENAGYDLGLSERDFMQRKKYKKALDILFKLF
jgi:hypothetical protein